MSNSDRRPWTPEVTSKQEDDAIKELVHEFGIKRWTLIAQLLVERYGIRGR
jgi:hypothetical protein